jgi:site-specific DNA recombinase
MTWASYARVSSDGQTGLDKYGLERQDRDNDRYIRALGYEGAITKFRDVISGTKESRLEFERLLEHARAKKVTRVCIPEGDRLAREVFVSAALIFEFWAAGLEVHNSQKGLIDRKSGSSRREFFRDAIEADAELEKISRRMYQGKLDKVRSGKPANSLRAYGWHDGVQIPEEVAVLRWIVSEVAHRGLNTIARELNAKGTPSPSGGLWHHSSLRVLLKNPTYIGRYEFGRKGERLTLEVPALLTLEEWHRAQAALTARGKGQGKPGTKLEVFELQTRIKCAVCGYAMSGWQPQKRYHAYYVCSNSRSTSRALEQRCTHKTVYQIGLIHEATRAGLEHMTRNNHALESAIPAPPAPRDTTNDRARLTTRLARAKLSYENGIDTLEEYAATKREILALMATLEVPKTAPPTRDPNEMRQRIQSALSHGRLSDVARAANLLVRVSPGGEVHLEIGL